MNDQMSGAVGFGTSVGNLYLRKCCFKVACSPLIDRYVIKGSDQGLQHLSMPYLLFRI